MALWSSFQRYFNVNLQGPLRARTEAALAHLKKEKDKIRIQQFTFEAGLMDQDSVFQSIGFTNFLSTWLIRQADPKKQHPNPVVQYVKIIININQQCWLKVVTQVTTT